MSDQSQTGASGAPSSGSLTLLQRVEAIGEKLKLYAEKLGHEGLAEVEKLLGMSPQPAPAASGAESQGSVAPTAGSVAPTDGSLAPTSGAAA